MKKATVIDTNVIVSGVITPHGPPGRIVELLRAGKIAAIVDDRIIDEYITVLERPVFGIPKNELDILMAAIRRHAQWVAAPTHIVADNSLPDPDDAPFLECARAADVPLVTGNAKHFPLKSAGDTPILTPAMFVGILDDINLDA